jgi:hypothetical protein
LNHIAYHITYGTNSVFNNGYGIPRTTAAIKFYVAIAAVLKGTKR